MLSSRRGKVFGARLRGEEPLFQVGTDQKRQPPPLFDGQKHSSFDAAPGYDLWSFCESGIQQLVEPRLCFLNRPILVHSSPV